MRRLIPFIAIGVVLSASASLFAQEWTDFTSKEDRFKIKFPGQPKVTDKIYESDVEYRCFMKVCISMAHALTGTKQLRVRER